MFPSYCSLLVVLNCHLVCVSFSKQFVAFQTHITMLCIPQPHEVLALRDVLSSLSNNLFLLIAFTVIAYYK